MKAADLQQHFHTGFDREKLTSAIHESDELFQETLHLALSNKQPAAWRAAWILFHASKTEDPRLVPHVQAILDALTGKKDGHQRELLKILKRMALNEHEEGQLFDFCIRLWEQPSKQPALRYHAFLFIIRTLDKYPELTHELHFLSQQHYLDPLSPGIRKSLERIIRDKKIN
jgi:hypothetical protein